MATGDFLKGFNATFGEAESKERTRLFETAMLSKRLEMEGMARSIPTEQLGATLKALGAPEGTGAGVTHPKAQEALLGGFKPLPGANIRAGQGSRYALPDNITQAMEQEYGLEPGRLRGATPGSLPYLIGQTAVNPVTGETMGLGPRSKVVNVPGSAEAGRTLAKAEQFKVALDDYEKLLKELPDGRIAGRGVDWLNRLTGFVPEAATARGLQDALIPLAARVVGGDVGNLSETEQKRAYQIVPKLSGTAEERSQAANELRGLLSTIVERQKAVQSGMFKNAAPGSRPNDRVRDSGGLTKPRATPAVDPNNPAGLDLD